MKTWLKKNLLKRTDLIKLLSMEVDVLAGLELMGRAES